MFGVYMVSAMTLFGKDLPMFADLDRSLNSCWRVLLGDFEWNSMTQVGRLEAAIWFWSFSWLVLLVMLEMSAFLISA